MHFGLHCCISTTTTPASRERGRRRPSVDWDETINIFSVYISWRLSVFLDARRVLLTLFLFRIFFCLTLFFTTLHTLATVWFPSQSHFKIVNFSITFLSFHFMWFSFFCIYSLLLSLLFIFVFTYFASHSLESKSNIGGGEKRREKNTTRICWTISVVRLLSLSSAPLHRVRVP